ncbi:MAG: phosphate ABC transporter substrate-binding protein [Caldilineaceae bacterium]|nr:phosphate ABC transporter substrate-binding protein [Caldilineaceae bacterium]
MITCYTRSLGWLLAVIVSGWLLVACQQSGLTPTEPVNLSIAGSTEMMPLLIALTDEFSNRHPHVIFSLRGGGSSLGESWVAEGRMDLAASTLLYEDSQLPNGLTRVPIGLDGIAVIVHASNPITGLTLLQLRDLYNGRALDWTDVGGEEGEVLLVSREDGSGTRDLFEERVMGEDGVALTAVIMPTSKDVIAYVATHPETIGYVSQAYARAVASTVLDDPAYLERIRIIEIEEMLPDGDTIGTQTYHLSRPLFLLRRTQARGWPQQFIDFVLSPAGQRIVARYHVRIR